MRILAPILTALVLQAGAGRTLAPWGADARPGDAPKRHLEEISARRHAYAVRQGGTMDGTNCRTPLSVGMMDGPAIEQTWESNRAVRLENVGETDVVNPWLSNGRNDFRTLDEIVAAAVRPGMTDREKAFALWRQQIRHRYHWEGDNEELGDPVRVFNVYGHNTCGNDSICLAGLWKRTGLKVSPACVVGHCVTQVYFDGRWNLFDGDMHAMYLLRDNRTVASERDLVRDHDLVKRAHTQGILNPASRANDEWQASAYILDAEPVGTRDAPAGTTMNMTLRPGEAITWRWGHETPVRYHGPHVPRYPGLICNGLWEYAPDFSRDLWRRGAADAAGVRSSGGRLEGGEGGGRIEWTIRVPYVLVGGRLEVEGQGVRFALSWDGRRWQECGRDLDAFFPPAGPARYGYRLRCTMQPGGLLSRLRVVNDLQMAPLALPGMTVGENRFVYTEESVPPGRVRITHDWVERSETRPPGAPPAPLHPQAGGEAEASRMVFRWQPARDPDGDRIADYEFELSDRPDMAWPLSTNFHRLIGKTPDRGRERYTLPQDGLLPVDVPLYWRVRAKDERGVWGAWSETWSFTARGPSPPADVTLAVDRERGTAVLRWRPGSAGRRPARYRIYGSDEKGFSASDTPYRINVGVSREIPAEQPANFCAEVAGTEAAVIGPDVRLPNANRAHYRVVAVDARGTRSGPSDAATAPRPLIWSAPIVAARAGTPYRYRIRSLRSLGDARTRVVNGKQLMSYWDIESPRYRLRRGPAWLRLDEETGLLSGVPAAPGRFPVEVEVTIDRETRALDRQLLSWGIEKVLSSNTERAGAATQRFTLRVAPRAGR